MPTRLTTPAFRLEKALRLAVVAHRGQRRKDSRTPYVVHPIGVLRHLVSDLGITDVDLACAAVLHDVVEDTPVSIVTVRRRFGPRVARIVASLTLPAELHGEEVAGSAKTARLLHDLASMPWEAVVVKLCDRWDNLRDMANALWGPAKRAYYRDQTRQVLAAVRARARTNPPPPGLREAVRRAQKGVAAAVEARKERSP